MKTLFLSALVFLSVATVAQEADGIKPAAKGVVYGEAISTGGTPVPVNELQAKMAAGAFEGKVTGKVKEVCKAMGCWMKLEREDGTELIVTSKDHAYFMPQDLAGKTVVVEGTATVKEVSEAKRKHLAEDAGKSKAELKKIRGATQEIQFVAKGVEVLD